MPNRLSGERALDRVLHPQTLRNRYTVMRKNILERLERIDRLIRIKGTGNPAKLAARLKMSERSLYQYLNLMRELGAPIKFDQFRDTYYYSEDGQFIISFQRSLNEKQKTISALIQTEVQVA